MEADPSDDFKLTPPNPPDSRPSHHFKLRPADDEGNESSVDPEWQFSLVELLGLMAFAAVLFTGFRWLPPARMALVTGILSMTTLAMSGWLPQRRTIFVMAWWLILFTYILSICLSMIENPAV